MTDKKKKDKIKKYIQVKIGDKNIQVGFNLNIEQDRDLYFAISEKQEIITKNTRIKLLLDEFYNNSTSKSDDDLLESIDKNKDIFITLPNQIKKIILPYYLGEVDNPTQKIHQEPERKKTISNHQDVERDDLISQIENL